MDKSKSEFEKAWSERKFFFGQTVSIKDIAEEFWNKARESVAVELPDSLFECIEIGPSIDGNSDSEISFIDIITKQKVTEYLEAAGIKVVIK